MSFASIRDLPVLFAQVGGDKDRTFVCVQLTKDNDGLQVWAVDSNDVTHRSTFLEVDLAAMKQSVDKTLTWERFFSGIEDAFYTRKVQITPEAGNQALGVECLLFGDGGKVCFSLPRVKESNGSVKILAALCEYYWLREDEQFQFDYVAKLEREAADAERALDVVLREKKAMLEVLARAPATESAARQRREGLEKELMALERARADNAKRNPSHVEERIGLVLKEAERLASYARVPLTDSSGNEKDCIELDTELMSLVKGRFMPLSGGGGGKGGEAYNAIVAQVSDAEHKQALSALTDQGKQIVMRALEKIDQWDFDVFAVQHFSGGHALFYTLYALLLRYGLFSTFGLDEVKVVNFLSQIEAGYQPNPYHNSTHAADVLHITHYIIKKGGLQETSILKNESLFAALIAAAIHDYDHPGINNNFHIKSQSYLARLYSDRSILENHHVSEVFELMKDPRFDILSVLPPDARKDVHDTVVDMVLATDMGLHQRILQTFKKRLSDEKDQGDKAGGHLLSRKEDQRLAMSMAIKMADISNCGRPENLYLTWATKIHDEFFLQGDRELNIGVPISPFMDRSTPSMAKSQVAFMNFVVVPLFESMSDFLPKLSFTVDLVESNMRYWQEHDDTTI